MFEGYHLETCYQEINDIMCTCLTIGKSSDKSFSIKWGRLLNIYSQSKKFPLRDDIVPFGNEYLIVNVRPIK